MNQHDGNNHSLNQRDENERESDVDADGEESPDGEARRKAPQRPESDPERRKAESASPPPIAPVADRQPPSWQADDETYCREFFRFLGPKVFGAGVTMKFASHEARLFGAAGSWRNLVMAAAAMVAKVSNLDGIRNHVAYLQSVAEGLRDDPENAEREAAFDLLFLHETEMAFQKAHDVNRPLLTAPRPNGDRAAVRKKPLTDHQRRIAAHREVAFAPLTEAEMAE